MSEITRISASAGSGKTYRLTRDFLSLLGGGGKSTKKVSGEEISGRLKRLLAITFTNAAAAEMRNRVIEALKENVFNEKAGKETSLANAEQFLEQILYDYSALNIRTIDSLLQMIVRASAFELGLNPDFEPSFNESDVFQPYLEQLFIQAEKDDKMRELLKEAYSIGVSHEQFKGFRADDKFETQLYKILIKSINKEFDNIIPLEDLIDEINTLEKDLQKSARQLRKELDKYGNEDIHIPNSKKLDRQIDLTYDTIDLVATASDFFKGKRKKQPVAPEVEKAFQAWHQNAVKCRDNNLVVLKKAVLISKFISVAKLVGDLYAADRQENKSLPSALIPGLTASLLGSDKGVSDALCRIGTNLTHFLIDEFQDTSTEQWKVLKSLVHEGLSRGGSMTFVGDRKQSIYRFRGGNPELFDDALNDKTLLAVAKAKKESLKTNRRSFKEIVEHNNNFFEKLGNTETSKKFLENVLGKNVCPDVTDKAAEALSRIYGDVVQEVWEEKKGKGIVAYLEIKEDKTEEVERRIMENLINLLKNKIGAHRKWSDILILCRSNDDCNEYAKELIANDIPVITENSLLLSEHSLVAQSLGFLRFLANKNDDVAFWSVAQGSILQEHPLWKGPDKAKLSSMAMGRGKAPLYEIFKAMFPDEWDKFFTPFFKTPSLVSAYDAVRQWYEYLDVTKRFPAERTFLLRFLEILYAMNQQDSGSIMSFLEKWAEMGETEKVPMPDNADAVSIMTFHKAKGLQQKIVILPKTNFYSKASGETFVGDINGRKIPMIARSNDTPHEYEEDLLAQILENLNTLYVGFTRASEELYYFRNINTKYATYSLEKGLSEIYKNVSSLSIDELPDIMRQQPAISIEAASEVENLSLPDESETINWLPRLKIFRAHPSVQAMTAAERGTFLHSCLERLNPVLEPEKAVDMAMQQTIRQTHYRVSEEDAKIMRKNLLWFATKPEVFQWLRKGWKEQGIMTENGEVRRMDLIVPDGKDVLVVDYKTGQPHDEHIAQIREYLRDISAEGHFTGKTEGILVYLDLQKFKKITLTDVSDLSEEI